MGSIYYIFCYEKDAKKEEFGLPFSDYNAYAVTFNEQQCIRLFESTELAGENLIVFEGIVKEYIPRACIENQKYYSDCNHIICEYLKQHRDVFGWSSQKMNAILNMLFMKKDSIIYGLRGDEGWGSLEEVFQILKDSGIEYLVLRKYETLPFGYLDGDHDIDILCNSLFEVRLVTGAQKRNIGISAYCLIVDNEQTDFDIRFVGDGYFDASWETDCLNKRVVNLNGISVMDEENQLFTIIYHVLTQKNEISEYYYMQINALAQKVFKTKKNYREEMYYLLTAFMRAKSYYHVRPLDASVVQNYIKIAQLNKDIYVISDKKKNIMRFYSIIPDVIKKHLTKKMLDYFFETR